jgi:N-acetyl sugar amidotransferase
MDTTDPNIIFDENGVCNHCKELEKQLQTVNTPKEVREKNLSKLLTRIKTKGEGKEYDCIVGVSGGVDSTYLVYYVKKVGLRPLAIHMDNGWDSELAVSNIEKTLRKLDIDLFTYVLDWEEFKDLQLAFLKASVSDAEIPTDHAISAALYTAAAKHGIHYILLGANLTTEGILPLSWTYGVRDWRYIHSVHKKFGKRQMRIYPHYDLRKLLYYTFIRNIKVINFLDYLQYSKQEAMRVLKNELGWREYGGKHYESIYTRFFQGYILPTKFGIDKRKAHLSTLILSGQMKREEAIKELQSPPYAGYMFEEDMEYVMKKLELSREEFDQLMLLPIRSHIEFPTYKKIIEFVRQSGLKNFLSKINLWPGI